MRQPPSRLTSTQVARTRRSLATASCPGKMIPSSLTTMAVSPVRKRTSTGRAATRDPLSGPAARRIMPKARPAVHIGRIRRAQLW